MMGTAMIRTQVRFTEAQMRKLKRLASERGVSVAALIREAIDLLAGRAPARGRRALPLRPDRFLHGARPLPGRRLRSMSVFVDTSALLAVLDAGDAQHPHARAAWETLLQQDEPLVTTSYVLVETFAHRLGVTALVAAGRRRLSLVDCVSFATPPSPSTGASGPRAFARSPEPGLRR